MAGYVVHLAIAKEYLRKHPQSIHDEKEFLKGVIAPDLQKTEKDKADSHFSDTGESSRTNLKKFLIKEGLDTDFQKGYFLHLYTDLLFHNIYFYPFDSTIYRDYDRSNKDLIAQYDISIPDAIKNKIGFTPDHNYEAVKGYDFFTQVIDEISSYDLDIVKEETLNGNPKWQVPNK